MSMASDFRVSVPFDTMFKNGVKHFLVPPENVRQTALRQGLRGPCLVMSNDEQKQSSNQAVREDPENTKGSLQNINIKIC